MAALAKFATMTTRMSASSKTLLKRVIGSCGLSGITGIPAIIAAN
jgi:hypothetical protein